MVRGITYGKTWWGNAWVKALEIIDYDANRLPRGKRYANAGRVSGISIAADGAIKAKVQGTRQTPYRVEIKLKTFSVKEKDAIKSLIASDPALASELSMGRLPDKMLDLAKTSRTSLLPSSWDEIFAHCSCPDWANPCKHLAAVYYILANEIDKDPFLLFKLRGLDALELLQAAGFVPNQAKPGEKDGQSKQNQLGNLGKRADRLEQAMQANQTNQANQSGPHFVPVKELIITAEEANTAKADALGDLESNIDLSGLANSKENEAVFALFGESPFFYPAGNFKTILLKAYKNIARSMEKLELLESAPYLKSVELTLCCPADQQLKRAAAKRQSSSRLVEEYTFFIHALEDRGSPFPFGTGAEKEQSIPFSNGAKLMMKRKHGRSLPVDAVLQTFLALPLELPVGTSSPWVGFLSAATAVAQALARSSSFVPVLKGLDAARSTFQGRFGVFYRPLDRSGRLRQAVQYLASIMPPGFVFCPKEKGVLVGQEAVEELLTVILSHIVWRFAGIDAPDKVCRAFFSAEYYLPQRFEEQQNAKAISDWLGWLNLQAARISPVINVIAPSPDHQKFKLKLRVEDTKNPLAPMLPLADVFSDRTEIFSLPIEGVRQEVAYQLIIAGEYVPVLKKLLSFRGHKFANLTLAATADFLREGQHICALLGIRVMIPRELKKLASPQVELRAQTKNEGEKVSYFNLDQMLDFSWQVSLGDVSITNEEFIQLAQSAEGIVRFKEQYLLLNPEEVKNILAKLSNPAPRLSSMQTLQASITGEAGGVPFNPGEVLQKLVEDLTVAEEVSLPAGLQADLRPYQQRGFHWLYANTAKGLGCCLADDMGLGKTLQVITLILKLKEEGRMKTPALVICPTTLIGNWAKECARFAPSLEVAVYHGGERQLNTKGVDLIVTSYGILRRDLTKFKRLKWDLMVIDEAQNIKNPESDQTRAVKSLQAKGYVAMSGTPVENRLLELWSIFDFINRGYLGGRQDFISRFALPVEKYRDQEKIRILKNVTAPFLLRRLKTDQNVISDLPDKVIINEYCYLTKEQAALYQQVLDTMMGEIEHSEGISRKGLVFKLMTALKQVCNHPVQYTKKGRVEQSHSGKAQQALALLARMMEEGEKALVFTQYREMGELLVELIRRELRAEALFFHGGVPRKKRDAMVEEFQQNNGAVQVMVVSLKAGGTGLNLTAATNVIHYDLWWNPAVEDQATDRTYRIGQTKNVMVHRLICLGTFEEKIDEMISAKKELAELTVAAGEARLSELSNAELKEILMLAH